MTNCGSYKQEENCFSNEHGLFEEDIDDTQTDCNLSNGSNTAGTNAVDFVLSHVCLLSQKVFPLVPQPESTVSDAVLISCKRDISKDSEIDEASCTTAHHHSRSMPPIEMSQEQALMVKAPLSRHSNALSYRVCSNNSLHHRRSSSEPSAVLSTCFGTQKPAHLASGEVIPTAGIVMAIAQIPTVCTSQKDTIAKCEHQLHPIPKLKRKRAYSAPPETVDQFEDEDTISQNAGILMTINCVQPVFVTEEGKPIKEEFYTGTCIHVHTYIGAVCIFCF